jgi:hypothetical protein
MAAFVSEASDGSLGDKLGTTSVKFSLYKYNNTTMATADYTCTAPVVANNTTGTGTANCDIPGLGADNYTVKAELVSNPYYLGTVGDGAATVTLAGTGFTTGGGWLADSSGNHNNFGFTVKYLKNGNIQGNSLYIYRVRTDIGYGTRDYNWIIKSNSMGGLTQTCPVGSTTGCKATFTGKSTITAVDRITGAAYSLGGNNNFQVDVTDKAEPGSAPGTGPDTYAIRVWTASGTYYQLGTPAAQQAINGGNIQVRP